jgi:hypothetical protein
MLKDWVNKALAPHGIFLDVMQNITNFFLSHFVEANHIGVILNHGS